MARCAPLLERLLDEPWELRLREGPRECGSYEHVFAVVLRAGASFCRGLWCKTQSVLARSLARCEERHVTSSPCRLPTPTRAFGLVFRARPRATPSTHSTPKRWCFEPNFHPGRWQGLGVGTRNARVSAFVVFEFRHFATWEFRAFAFWGGVFSCFGGVFSFLGGVFALCGYLFRS